MDDLKTFEQKNKRQPTPEELKAYENEALLAQLLDVPVLGAHKKYRNANVGKPLQKEEDTYRLIPRSNALRLMAAGDAKLVPADDKDYKKKLGYALGEHRKPKSKQEGDKDALPSVRK